MITNHDLYIIISQLADNLMIEDKIITSVGKRWQTILYFLQYQPKSLIARE